MRRVRLLAARVLRTSAAASVLLLGATACGDDGGGPGDIPNPPPTISAITPAVIAAGSGAFTAEITGTGFVRGSIVSWNGVERPATYVSETRISASVGASEITQPGTALVTVSNAPPGGGMSAIFQVPIGNPVPVLAGVTPATVTAGSSGFTLVVTGTGFVSQSVVRWNGEARPTTFVNATQLSATIPASDVAASGVAQVSVHSPAPLGGTSASLPVSMGSPPPAISSLSPAQAVAGGGAFTLTVNGANFLANSVVQWNGAARATTFASAGQLTAAITAADAAVLGPALVTVMSPPPGGGTSNGVQFSMVNPVPTLASLSPATLVSGSAAFTLTVDGSNFASGSVVTWNGGTRPTQVVSATRLTASISASDVATPGTAQVRVVNPAPGGGTSAALPFTISLAGLVTAALPARDLVWDATRQRIYASVSSGGGANANSVVAIDPTTGQVTASVFVGSEPGRLALAHDASVLYVTLDGAAAVRRIELATFTAGLQFGVWHTGTLYAEDIEVMPGAPGTVAISLMNPGSSPRLAALAIYDDGVRRPTTGPGHTGSNRIEFGADATQLYGYNNETTEFGFRLNTITASGVTETWVSPSLISGFGVDIEYDGGRIYASNGAVVDPVTRARVGTIAATGFVRPDAARARVYFVEGTTIRAFGSTTFASTGTLVVPGVGNATGSLIRWGTDGLAFRTAGEVVMLRTNLVP